MGVFSGKKILKKDGSLVDAEAELEGKVILLYFSAHWCPPCRGFTPILKDCYEDLEDKPLAIIFVSSDNTQEDMDAYYNESHGDWYRAPFGSEWARELKTRCQVSGIPTLAVVDKEGKMLHKSARDDVMNKTPSEAFNEWLNL